MEKVNGRDEQSTSNDRMSDAQPNILPSRMSCTHRTNGRNLIVCIDGTSNQFGTKNTNVIELYSLILKEVEDNQLCWYNSGIGTYARPSYKSLKFYKKVLYHKIDLAIAWIFERTVLGAYRWLSDNYMKGDCIFLFGFSRGAFQVRVLSAMIDKVGMIHKGNEMQIPFAYELYSDPKSDVAAEKFKNTFSHRYVRVHFVGACIFPRTIDGMKHVCYFRHALALDERRVKFLPDSLVLAEKDYTPKARFKDSNNFWSDLRDQGFKSEWLELDLDDHTQKAVNHFMAGQHESALHTLRKIALSIDGQQAVYEQVIGALKQTDRPDIKNKLLECAMDILEDSVHANPQLELWPSSDIQHLLSDLYSSGSEEYQKTADKFVAQFTVSHIILRGHSNEVLCVAFSPDGKHLVSGSNDKTLRIWDVKTRKLVRLPLQGHDDAVFAVAFSPDGKLIASGSGDGTVRIWDVETGNSTTLDAHDDWVRCVAFSRDGSLVVSGSDDATVRIWHVGNGTLERSLQGHDHWVYSVAFLANDKRVVSGSRDNTIRLWDLKEGNEVKTLKGHEHSVLFISVSPNGELVASCSGDKKIRLWNASTGEQVGQPLQGHADRVLSIAFLSDMYLVSGSCDKTVRLWDIETGKQVTIFQQDTDQVSSVATYGTLVASGSADTTIRIWDVGIDVGAKS